MGHAEIMENVVYSVLEDIQINHIDLSPMEITERVIEETNMEFAFENWKRGKWNKIRLRHVINHGQLAIILSKMCPIKVIKPSMAACGFYDKKIGVYQFDGHNKGLYDTSKESLIDLMKLYCPDLSDSLYRETKAFLRDTLPEVAVCDDKDLIAYNNGIYDVYHKKFMLFSEDYVFVSKLREDFVE